MFFFSSILIQIWVIHEDTLSQVPRVPKPECMFGLVITTGENEIIHWKTGFQFRLKNVRAFFQYSPPSNMNNKTYFLPQEFLVHNKRRTETEEAFQSLVNFTSHLPRKKAFLEKNRLTQHLHNSSSQNCQLIWIFFFTSNAQTNHNFLPSTYFFRRGLFVLGLSVSNPPKK